MLPLDSQSGEAVVMKGDDMVRQLTVDFNRTLGDDLVRGNARHAAPSTVVEVGSTLIVGDDDWGVAPAEVVEYDPDSGSLVLRVLAPLQPESAEAEKNRLATG